MRLIKLAIVKLASAKPFIMALFKKPATKTAVAATIVIGSIGIQGCASISSATAAGISATTDRRDSDTIIDDRYIETKAMHAVHNQAFWKESHVTVVSYNHNLLIVGQVPTEADKQKVSDSMKGIPNVRQVYNELSVGKTTSFTERSKDSWITTQIKAKLVSNKEVKASHVKVITEDGIVYLMGLTSRKEEIAATEIARAVKNVKKVVQIFELKT